MANLGQCNNGDCLATADLTCKNSRWEVIADYIRILFEDLTRYDIE